jgi:hypothetical protein
MPSKTKNKWLERTIKGKVYTIPEDSQSMDIFNDIRKEINYAEAKFPEYNSTHEGYSVIAEEVDELWDLVKLKEQDYEKEYYEAKHIACTAIRFMKMCLRKGGGDVTRKIYREEAKDVVKESLKNDPLMSLNDLSKKTGYCKAFLGNIYGSVRRSNEWKTWKEKKLNENETEGNSVNRPNNASTFR